MNGDSKDQSGARELAERDARRARGWGWTLLEKTEGSQRGPLARYTVAGRRGGRELHADRWDQLRTAYARQVLADLDADLSRLGAAAAACRAEYDYRRATELPDRRLEACRIGADLADAAAVMARNAGLVPDAGRAARDAVLRELQPHHRAGPLTRLRRRWALALDARSAHR